MLATSHMHAWLLCSTHVDHILIMQRYLPQQGLLPQYYCKGSCILPLMLLFVSCRHPPKVCPKCLLQNVLKTTVKRTNRDRAPPANTSPEQNVLKARFRALSALNTQTYTCKPSGVTRRAVTLFLLSEALWFKV